MMLLEVFLLASICVAFSLAGVCQDVFKNSNEDRPFFKIFESQSVEIYYPKRDNKQEMFGIKIYKNKDLRKKDLTCDLCVNTTHVEDGCFKIKSNLLAVDPRDVLKYVTLTKVTGKPDVTVSAAKKAEFSDYVIPAGCTCKASPGGHCGKASSKISDYRPLFIFYDGTRFMVNLPKAPSTAIAGIQALKNDNFRTDGKQNLDLNVDSFSERSGCFVYESPTSAPRFALGDHINFVVTGKKTSGEKIRTAPRKAFLNDYFVPSFCDCPPEQLNFVKPQKPTGF